MEKYFVLLGGNKLLWGQVCHLRELGYKVIVVAWNDHPDIKGDLFIQLDVKDSEAIIAKLEELGLKGKVGGALSSIDLAAPTVNAINGWCGNKTMPEKFNKVLSKEEMRDCWMKAGVFNRISKMDDEFPLDEIYEASQKMKPYFIVQKQMVLQQRKFWKMEIFLRKAGWFMTGGFISEI